MEIFQVDKTSGENPLKEGFQVTYPATIQINAPEKVSQEIYRATIRDVIFNENLSQQVEYSHSKELFATRAQIVEFLFDKSDSRVQSFCQYLQNRLLKADLRVDDTKEFVKFIHGQLAGLQREEVIALLTTLVKNTKCSGDGGVLGKEKASLTFDIFMAFGLGGTQREVQEKISELRYDTIGKRYMKLIQQFIELFNKEVRGK